MEVITIESKAYSLLMEKLDKITAYVEETRLCEEAHKCRGEELKTDGRKRSTKWMTNKEACEALEISPRTLQLYRTNRVISYSMIGKQIRYPRKEIEHFRDRWMVETPDTKIDRMITEHPLHTSKSKNYGKKRRNTGENE